MNSGQGRIVAIIGAVAAVLALILAFPAFGREMGWWGEEADTATPSTTAPGPSTTPVSPTPASAQPTPVKSTQHGGGNGNQGGQPTTPPPPAGNPYSGPANLLFASPMTSQGSLAWGHQDGGMCGYAADGYHVKGSSDYSCHGYYDLRDLTIEVKVKFVGDSSVGVTVRDDNNGRNYFRITLDAGGEVTVSKIVDGVSTTLRQDVYVGAKAERKLAITAVGTNIRIYVDGSSSAAVELTESALSAAGGISFLATGCCSPTERVISDVRVWA